MELENQASQVAHEKRKCSKCSVPRVFHDGHLAARFFSPGDVAVVHQCSGIGEW